MRIGVKLHRQPRQRGVAVRLLAILLLLGPWQANYSSGHNYHFDISPQQLTTALLEFARQSRLSIGFPDPLTDGLQSAGVSGEMSIAQALEQLLAGTGLTYQRFGRDVVRIRKYEENIVAPAPERDTSENQILRSTMQPQQRRIEEIVTIGSHIENARIAGMLPTTVLNRARIEAVGASSAGEVFRSLPSAGIVNFNGIDNYFYGVNDARGDVASVNLRELGSGNTLMLINGRRMVMHPGVQAEGRVLATTVNSNVLPLQAIRRIEVLRDGASSIYGSEAVGGVVDTLLFSDFSGFRAELQHGIAESSSLNDTVLSLQAGMSLGSNGHIAAFASILRRKGMPAADRHFSRYSDMRPLFANSDFANDADVSNTSASSAWGQFHLPTAVTMNGQPITTPGGLFHVQPASFSGCVAELPNNICIDDDIIDDALRSDSNQYRYLAPDLDRNNLFVMLSRSLAGNMEVYGEVGWYDARSRNTREPANPLSSHPITIPAHNYWNPFGPEVFADGRNNPNRLPGIDAPAEGQPIVINTRVLGSFYRVIDAGPREIIVHNDSRRLLTGLRGKYGTWHWDSALLYSDATTADTTYNRISSSLFQAALDRDTANAYNPFNGGDPDNLSYGDATANPQDIIDGFLIDVSRHNKTSLALADLHLSNPEFAQAPAGPVGLGLGLELRRERFAEDRDPRLDGTIGYTDRVSGIEYASDVMQSSATPDSAGSRTAHSVFAEVTLPLVDAGMGIPGVEQLDAQFALRFERFSDVGEELKPRAAVSWMLTPELQLRAAWSQGFRAPNLPQVNAGPVPRLQVVRDWYRCRALLNKGEIPSLGACVLEAVRAVEVITSGSASLSPENNSNSSLGLVLRPLDDHRLTITADYWRIAQTGIVGLFGEQNHLALDYLRRLGDESNPAVLRAPLRQEDIDLFAGSGLEPVGLLLQVEDAYVNLDRRVTRGIDFGAFFDWNATRAGEFRLGFEATRLLAADQAVAPLGAAIVELGEPAIPLVGAGSLLEQNGRPRWRLSSHLDWQRGDWRAGVLAQYVGKVVDTSAIQDQTDAFLRVGSWATFNVFAELRLPEQFGQHTRLRAGVRNLFDRDPPLADEALGHFVGLHESQGRYLYLGLSSGP